MSQSYLQTGPEDWSRSDRYHNDFLIRQDDSLSAALDYSKESGLDDISVSEAQGKFLNLVARSIQARRILEVGLLGGYSTIWLAKALPPDGHLTTLEIDEKSVQVATKNLERAGVKSKVEIILGPAVETITKLEPVPPFDLIFIDADKQSNLEYFREAKRLIRQGGVIIVDNVVRYGRVSNPDYSDDKVEGVRRLLRYLKDDKEVDCTTLGTVGEKGYDGFIYSIKL